MTDVEFERLLRAAREGDGVSYRRLIEALYDRLATFFRRRLWWDVQSTEDLIQETLLSIHTSLASYDPDRPFEPWFFSIARHKWLDYRRRARRCPAVCLDERFPELRVEDGSAAADARKDVDKAMASLSVPSRAILRDLKIHGFSVAETAARAGVSDAAVRVSAHRALRRLARRFGADAAKGQENVEPGLVFGNARKANPN